MNVDVCVCVGMDMGADGYGDMYMGVDVGVDMYTGVDVDGG